MVQLNSTILFFRLIVMAFVVSVPIQSFAFPVFVLRNNNWGRIRHIEEDITNERVSLTLRVHNDGDDENLEWDVEILHNDDDWLEITGNLQHEVAPGQRSRAFALIMDGRQLEEDAHFYDTLRFTSNDPTYQIMDIPVAGHTGPYPRIEAAWPGEWGEWWGIDLENIYDEIYWGEEYPVQITVRNRGGAELVIDEIGSDNGYFTVEPDSFNLDAGGARAVRITFIPLEVGQQSATITSVSNAWNPRELSFRVIGAALPVFRMGEMIPDTVIDEDGGELLFLDLDSAFVSSDHAIDFEVESEGLITRIANDHTFYIRSRAHWNGVTEAIISATVGDSTLTDTFIVTVNPTPDPPGAFDLYYPYDGDTLYYNENRNIVRHGDDGDDTLFVWQPSFDPDEGDTLSYDLILLIDNSEVFRVAEIADTFYTLDALKEMYEQLEMPAYGNFSWKAVATDGENVRSAWSTNGCFLAEYNSVEESAILPGDYGLAKIFPNPFNSSLTVQVNVKQPETLTIRIYDINGRIVEQLVSRVNVNIGTHAYIWSPTELVSGKYLVKIETANRSEVYPVVLTR